MNHQIPVFEIGPQGEVMAMAIDSCVHCGFCLPACPTYVLLRDEMDSPRGRIVLMKQVLEGELELEDAAPHLDRCLGCQACVTACPSGVPYGELISSFRGWSEPKRKRSVSDKARRAALLKVLSKPKILRASAQVGRLAKPLAPLLPRVLRAPLSVLPNKLGKASKKQLSNPLSPIKGKVALLTGCAQQAFSPQIHQATRRVLEKNGFELVIPEGQQCCGAAALHTGAREEALQLVKANLEAFKPSEYAAILSNAAGCGAGLKEYPVIVHGQEEEEKAKAMAAKVQDISEFLVSLLQKGELAPFPAAQRPLKIAYQDACHLAHAQKVKAQPRQLLSAIPNVELVDIAEADLCCGSAGTYNIEQPILADLLGQRKVSHLLENAPDLIVSGNIGCSLQLQNHLAKQKNRTPLLHTIEVLDLAYQGKLGEGKP